MVPSPIILEHLLLPDTDGGLFLEYFVFIQRHGSDLLHIDNSVFTIIIAHCRCSRVVFFLHILEKLLLEAVLA
jgi:hypothetical protein